MNYSRETFGFPFDQSYLVFYQRLQEASLRLHQLYRIQLQGDWKENKVYSKISHDLLGVMNDSILKEAALIMKEKVAVFNRLRKAMRITLPENQRGLNDDGDHSCSMRTIEKEVGRFEVWLSKMKGYSEHKKYHKLLEEINAYREKLFADPISVERVIKTMLPDTPLTMNLKNKEYMQIILADKETLEERFAEIDSKEIHLGLARSGVEISTIHPGIKKIIRIPIYLKW